jgi:hypothetical protein
MRNRRSCREWFKIMISSARDLTGRERRPERVGVNDAIVLQVRSPRAGGYRARRVGVRTVAGRPRAHSSGAGSSKGCPAARGITVRQQTGSGGGFVR